MGSHVFFWEHPAEEVFVTGTFDDWGKTVKLEKVGNRFEKLVQLPDIEHRIYYKYVVDGEWVLDHTDPQEPDPAGNINNVLPPEHIQKNMAAAAAAAGGSSDLPGAFPETPAGDNQTFSVNPIPASIGVGNPVSIPAGSALPIQTRSVNDAVTLDQASYENAGKNTAPQLPEVVTPEKERAQKGGMFGIDNTPGAGTMIPESGLAIGAGAGLGAAALANSGPHISSVGPQSTTAQLAGQVPLEPRGGQATISSVGPQSTTAALAGQVPLESSTVPDVVEKSQETAHASPEASANPEAVAEKSAVEQELQSKVPEAPATSDNSFSGKAAGIAAGVAATATAAAAGAAAYVSSGKATSDAKSALPVSAQQKIDQLSGSASNGTPIASTVPDEVQESIAKAHQSPEAAANPVAVEEKSAVESELLKKVHPEQSAGEPAPTASAKNATTAPAATGSSTSHAGAAAAGGVAGSGATAAALAAITSEADSKNAAPASSPAQTPATAAAAKKDSLATPGRDSSRKPMDSRDVSPMTRGPNDTAAPTVTTGVATGTTETTSTPKKTTATPAAASSSTPASPASAMTGDDKKSKRKSGFFSKIKEKFHHHDKDKKEKA